MLSITECVIFMIFLFNIVGVFGNVQLLWTTCRKKFAHSKAGILLAMNAVYHITCLLSEIANATILLSERQLTRRTCYSFMMIYIFVFCQQAIMYLLISVDLLIALVFPIWYRLCSTKPYIVVFFILSTSFALPFVVWGWVSTDDEVVPFCNPPTALPIDATKLMVLSNTIMCCIILIIYGVVIKLVLAGGKSSANHRANRKAVRRLSVILLTFVFTWMAGTFAMKILSMLGLPQQTLPKYQNCLVIFPLLSYSQTFYVCIWRSTEYGNAFKEQLSIMNCKNSTSSKERITIKITTVHFHHARHSKFWTVPYSARSSRM